MLTVGAPVIYLSPQTSHTRKFWKVCIRNTRGSACGNGAGDELTRQIQSLRRTTAVEGSWSLAEATAKYSAASRLPRLVAMLEQNYPKMPI